MYKAGTPPRVKGAALGMLLLGILFPVISYGAGSVSLAWDPSTNGAVAGYNVYYGTASRTYNSQISSGTNLAASVTGLADGQTYYFAVTAVDALGNESDYSNEINYSTPSVNHPPTISSIANQSTSVNHSTAAIAFTVNDQDTGASSVTLSGSSSVTSVVPNANIVFGGSGSSRTVTITPASGVTGSSQITISASDGITNASTSFTLTVVQGNTPPTISAIPNQTVSTGQATPAIAFTVGDAETPASSLTISGTSASPTLVPNANIVFGGSGANRTVTVTPAAGKTGTAQITVSVSDGTTNTSTSFSVTVQQAPNTPPTISSISDQTTSMNHATLAIPFTVGDAESGASGVTVSGSSSVKAVVPNASIVFGGSGASRTVTITPAHNVTGTSQITITASDGTTNTSTSFMLTVVPSNTPPTISAIANQTVATGQPTAAIGFTVGDLETPVANLVVSGTSGNTGLVPNANIVFGGSGANRTVTVTPVMAQNGSAQITVSVSDGTTNTTTSFLLTVQASTNNTPPTISAIASQSDYEGQATGPIPFTIGDAETPAASLILSGASDNAALVPATNIVFGGSGVNRTVTITPVAGQTGNAQITISVSDGALSTPTSFELSVVQPSALASSAVSKGSYSGLFYESDAVRLQSAGSFKLTVSKGGKYSGSLQMAASRYSFSGQFGAFCQATNTVLRKGTTPLTLSFSLQPGTSTNQFVGNVSDGVWAAQMFGAAAVFSSKTNPAPYAGTYTLAIPGQDAPSLGNGFGSLKVDGNGNVKFSGTLADGTKISQSATLSADGTWGLFVPLYSGQGLVMAWISFQNRATDDLHGALSWLKQPSLTQHYYPGGLTLDGNVVGSVFAPGSILALNVEISKLQGGGTPMGSITSLKISASTGTFTGSILSQTNGQTINFQGALLQKPDAGYGFILGTDQSAPLMLTP